jgi:hypothetical protein
MTRILLVLFISISPFISVSQPTGFKVNDSKHITYLKLHPNYQLTDINNYLINFQFYQNKDAKLSFQSSSNALFALPNGTGAVYKLSKEIPNTFERIDSTLFHGYNNYAINFIYHDTIYSLGGYGIWHLNGQLRYFNAKKAEWELKTLDKLIPVTTEDLVDIRHRDGYIYTYLKNQSIEGVSQENNFTIDSVYKISITTGKVYDLGIASEELKKISKMPLSLYSNYGTIMLNSHEAILLDFEENKIKKWDAIEIGDLFLSRLGKIKTIIHNDSVIYYYTNNSLDSLVIPMHKMKYIGPIYLQSSKIESLTNLNNPEIYIFSLIALGVTFIYGIYAIRKKKQVQVDILNENNGSKEKLNSNFHINEFNIIEIDIINKLLQHINQEEKVNVETLNAILGVTRKSTEVQRKQRSQTIASINIKAKAILNIDEDVIIRIKNELDSRIVTYSIQMKYADQLKEYASISIT